MTNFSSLSDPKILNIEPKRIKIVRAKETAPLGTILDSFAQEETHKKDLAILNGRTLDEVVSAGTPIKVVPPK